MNLKSLTVSGWYLSTAQSEIKPLSDRMMAIANKLGSLQNTRGKSTLDYLIPLESDSAHKRSLSSLYGLGTQPWHIDLAHSPLPARYIIFGCLVAPENPVFTELAEWHRCIDVTHTRDLHAEPFLVRNGRKSFYATLQRNDQRFLRFDPGCMEPLTENGKLIVGLIQSRASKLAIQMNLKEGDILIIDNWRMLHRRMDAHHGQKRQLLRLSIKGEN